MSKKKSTKEPQDAILANESYQPSVMLDYAKKVMGVDSDAELCRRLGMKKPTISKIKHRTLMVGATLLLEIHEETDIPIKKLKRMMGDNWKIGGYR